MSGPNAKTLQADEAVKQIAEEWNDRLRELMADRGMSQQELARKINERFNAMGIDYQFTQKNVSAWVNVGLPDGRGGIHPFPKFEIMIQIARFFEVDLGYLTGEIECKTYSAQDASDYTGIEEKAVDNLRSIIHFERKYRMSANSDSFGAIASGILESPDFYGLLEEMRGLAALRDKRGKIWDAVASEFDEDLMRRVFKYHDDFVSPGPRASKSEVAEVEAINEAVFETAGVASEEREGFMKAAFAVGRAIDDCHNEECRLKLEESASRYMVQKKFEEIVESMYPSRFSVENAN